MVLPIFAAFSAIIPIATFSFQFKKLNRHLKYFALYLIFVAVVEFLILILALNKMHNVLSINFFSITEGILLLVFIRMLLVDQRLKNIMSVFITTYLLYWLYTIAFKITIFQFNSSEQFIKGIFIIIGSGLLLIQISRISELSLLQNYLFWLISAILIYFSLTLIVFYTATIVLDNQKTAMILVWKINSIATIIANLLFSFSFICYYRKRSLYI